MVDACKECLNRLGQVLYRGNFPRSVAYRFQHIFHYGYPFETKHIKVSLIALFLKDQYTF